MNIPADLDIAIQRGARLHAFMSGGGLRVIRLEHKGRLVAYGEAPDVSEALTIAAEDYAAGGRPYGDVYGKTRPHYLTGQSEPSGPVDAWLRQGRTFDAWHDGKAIVVEMRGLQDTKVPEGTHDRVLAGETVAWVSRGYTYESTPSRFPNSEPCVSTRVVYSPPGRSGSDPWMYRTAQRATAPCLADALVAALKAAPAEVSPLTAAINGEQKDPE